MAIGHWTVILSETLLQQELQDAIVTSYWRRYPLEAWDRWGQIQNAEAI